MDSTLGNHGIPGDKYSDFTLKLQDGTKLAVHKCILGRQSEYFCSMLDHPWVEQNMSETTIEDDDIASVMGMLRFMYCGKLPITKPTSCEDLEILGRLAIISDYYLIAKLTTAITTLLASTVRDSNAEVFVRRGALDVLTQYYTVTPDIITFLFDTIKDTAMGDEIRRACLEIMTEHCTPAQIGRHYNVFKETIRAIHTTRLAECDEYEVFLEAYHDLGERCLAEIVRERMEVERELVRIMRRYRRVLRQDIMRVVGTPLDITWAEGTFVQG